MEGSGHPSDERGARTAAADPQSSGRGGDEAETAQEGGAPQGAGADRARSGGRTRTARGALPRTQGAAAQPRTSRALMAVVADAGDRAAKAGDQYVSTEHLLIATAASDSEAGRILTEGGVDAGDLAAALAQLRPEPLTLSPIHL